MFKCLEIKKATMKGYSPSIIPIIIVILNVSVIKIQSINKTAKLRNRSQKAGKCQEHRKCQGKRHFYVHLLKKGKLKVCLSPFASPFIALSLCRETAPKEPQVSTPTIETAWASHQCPLTTVTNHSKLDVFNKLGLLESLKPEN